MVKQGLPQGQAISPHHFPISFTIHKHLQASKVRETQIEKEILRLGESENEAQKEILRKEESERKTHKERLINRDQERKTHKDGELAKENWTHKDGD